MENQQTPPKRKRRFGDRNDGRRVRTRGPMEGVAAYIMKDRVGSSNYVRDTIEMEPIEEYIRKKRKEGRELSLMHLIIAAYVRLVAQRPAINRFISGQKTYTRDDYVEIVLTIKKETGSLKWTLLAAVIPTVTGMLLCMALAGTARLFL